MTVPKQMNFRESSKRPLTPTPCPLEWPLSLEIMCMYFILSGPHTYIYMQPYVVPSIPPLILTTILFSYRSQDSGEPFPKGPASNSIKPKKVRLFQGIGQSDPRDPESSKVYKSYPNTGNSFFSLIDIMVIYYGGSITILDT